MKKKFLGMFQGRIGRGTFIGNVLVTILIISILGAVAVGKVDNESEEIVNLVVMAFVCIMLFLFLLSNNIRRWHDMNLSGWFSILNFIPYIGLIAFLVQIFSSGSKGENKYGVRKNKGNIKEIE